MSVDVTVVVPQRGQVDLTVACVRGLRQWQGTAPEIIVVDDGSPEADREASRELEHLGCRMVWRMPTGVTASWNAGWRAARGRVVVFLNNDVVIDGPFLEQLVRPLGQARVTGVRWREEQGVGRLLEGWCLALQRETLVELGGFDERMRVYFSDTELQRRIIGKWGPDGVQVPAGTWPVTHLGHRTAHNPAWREERQQVWRDDRRAFVRAINGPRHNPVHE